MRMRTLKKYKVSVQKMHVPGIKYKVRRFVCVISRIAGKRRGKRRAFPLRYIKRLCYIEFSDDEMNQTNNFRAGGR